MNYKWVTILGFAAIALSVLVGSVYGANESFVVISTPTSIPTVTPTTTIAPVVIREQPVYNQNNEVYRISQGANVYVNDTIDISGMGWNEYIAWFGQYSESDNPLYLIKLDLSRNGLKNFRLSPDVFASRLGMWYQYYGNQTERAGNLNLFNVHYGLRNRTVTYGNGTTLQYSELVSNTTGLAKPKDKTYIPDIRIKDYLLAIGDPLFINQTEPFKVWIFGRVDKLYDIQTNTTNITISKETFADWEPGTYTMIIQKAGKNTIYEVGYSKGEAVMDVNKAGDFVPAYVDEKFTSPWAKVKPVPLFGIDPKTALTFIKPMLDNTDDEYRVYSLEIEQPTVSIVMFDEVQTGLRANEFKNFDGLVTLMDVRGYTNLQNSTNITVTLDKHLRVTPRDLQKYSVVVQAERTSPGNMSMYRAYVPLPWNELGVGMHTITAEDPFGSIVYADFPVTILPADSYKPNATIKYAGNRNPWEPNLTIPEPIVVVQTKVIQQVITVRVTPSNEQIYEQQKLAQADIIKGYVVNGVTIVIILVVLVLLGTYGLSVYRRMKK